MASERTILLLDETLKIVIADKVITIAKEGTAVSIGFDRQVAITCLDKKAPAPAFDGLSADDDRTREHSSDGHVRMSDQILIDWAT